MAYNVLYVTLLSHKCRLCATFCRIKTERLFLYDALYRFCGIYATVYGA